MLQQRKANGFEYYKYDPSMVAAVIFAALFGITTFLHLFQMIRTRTWFFIPFVIGGFFELIGYIGRILSSQETPDWTLGPYIMQSLLLLLAPALFAASIYMTLGRIIMLLDGEAQSIIAKRWLTKIFVAGDVLSFLMQGSGGGILSGGKANSVELGQKIITAGLFVQLLFFGIFILTAGIFHVRIIRRPTTASLSRDVPWQKHMTVLYLASVLIMIRSVFRIVEYIQGWDGYLLKHEIYLYIFDALLMLLTMCVFHWKHPSEVRALMKGGVYAYHVFKMSDIRTTV